MHVISLYLTVHHWLNTIPNSILNENAMLGRLLIMLIFVRDDLEPGCIK